MDTDGDDGIMCRNVGCGYGYVITPSRLCNTLVRFGAYDTEAGFLMRPPSPCAWIAQEIVKMNRKRKAADAAAAAFAAAADDAADAD